MKVVSFKAEDELLEALDEIARRKKVAKSEIIRRALKKYIESAVAEERVATKRIRIIS